jgi:tRNA A-37 threonylcarbamoyl transferase component Bud32
MPSGNKHIVTSLATDSLPRVQRVERGWIKRAEPTTKNPWQPTARFMTRLLPWPLLRSTATTGDRQSVIAEAERLRAWKSAGLPVPELLEATPDHILTADAGQPLRGWLRTEISPARRLAATQLAARSLGQLHASGYCHGRPFLKDIVYDERQVAFIDLEESPEKVMPLVTAQVRDLMLFMMSCTALLGDSHPPEDFHALINTYWLANPSVTVLRVLRRNLNVIYWLALPLRLCPSRLLGRDGRQIVRGLAVLRRLVR